MGALFFCVVLRLELEVRVHEPLTAGVIITRIERGVTDCRVISSDLWWILVEQVAHTKGHLELVSYI